MLIELDLPPRPHTADDPTKYRTDADGGSCAATPCFAWRSTCASRVTPMMPSLKRLQNLPAGHRTACIEAVLNSEVADFEYFFDRVYAR